jgi:hypothetical protein
MFVGYSKGGKKTAYAGIHECGNCNNVTNFHLIESSFKPTVMFIPVAKFNLQYYVICSLCERGYELEKTKYDEMYRNSFNLPREEDVIPYYNLIDDALMKNDAKILNAVIGLFINGHDVDSNEIYKLIDSSISSNLSQSHKKYIIEQKLLHTLQSINKENK